MMQITHVIHLQYARTPASFFPTDNTVILKMEYILETVKCDLLHEKILGRGIDGFLWDDFYLKIMQRVQ